MQIFPLTQVTDCRKVKDKTRWYLYSPPFRGFLHCTAYHIHSLFFYLYPWFNIRLRRKPLALGRLANSMEKQTEPVKLMLAKYLTAVRLHGQKILIKTKMSLGCSLNQCLLIGIQTPKWSDLIMTWLIRLTFHLNIPEENKGVGKCFCEASWARTLNVGQIHIVYVWHFSTIWGK